MFSHQTSTMTAVVWGLLAMGAMPVGPAWVHAQQNFYDGTFDLGSLNGANGFVLNGIDANDRSGASVASAGDVNGDGITDLIIGAPGVIDESAGESYVVFGGGNVGSGAAIDLDSLDGSNGFVLNGIDEDDFSGRSVASAGDVNGDGVADLIIGANGADPGGNSAAGESYVVFGGASVGSGGAIDLDSLDGSNGYVLNGIDAGDASGFSAASAGDVNGDGIADLIIGANQAEPGGINTAGESYVVFGGGSVGSGGAIDLGSLDGSNGFVLNGFDPISDSGDSVASAGDINGDGIADLIIGAPRADPGGINQAGQSYVVFGGGNIGSGGAIDLGSLNGSNGFVLNGIDAGDNSGDSVASAGDVNGDGIADLIIGADLAGPGGNDRAGESYIVFGGGNVGSGGAIDLGSLDGSNGFVLNGIDEHDSSGFSVASAGDVNGDGIADLIIGAPAIIFSTGGNPNAGESYVVFGGESVGSGGSIDLGSLDGSNGFVLNGIDADDRSGTSVASAGDVNDDGITDLIIGAPSADPGGNTEAGENYVVFGVSELSFTPLAGGDFDDPNNFLGGKVPGTTGGVVILEPELGGTIAGPASPVIADRFSLGAELGVTTLELEPGGAVLVRHDVTLPASARITGEGTFAVEGTLTNAGEIDLGAGSLQVAADMLNNSGLLRGVGTVDAPVTNTGRIEAFDLTGEMDFRGSVTNQSGGLMAMRDSALRFEQGLTNHGQLSVGDGAGDVFGDVSNTADGTIGLSSGAVASFVGNLDQEGEMNLLSGSRAIVFDTFSGSGGTIGPGTLEVLGLFDPGSSPASVPIGGDLVATGGTLIEIAGTATGEFDQALVGGNLTLDGMLTVELLDDFTPSFGDEFLIFDVAGTRTGMFDGLGEGALVGTFGGVGLFVTYQAGDGNDVVLFSVPEPSTLMLLATAAAGFGLFLPRRRFTAADNE